MPDSKASCACYWECLFFCRAKGAPIYGGAVTAQAVTEGVLAQSPFRHLLRKCHLASG